ncbi:hypothetical protein E4U43_005506 [Claviceps pusilla]|uniref:Uncharacterized protein n=1 Tax=Claviceps pusilla TaxID=123648 RepID=A0A9P7N4D8_9HYPO|nr:hypothetical protein E4U43_005506 [Claviceps pusilla]
MLPAGSDLPKSSSSKPSGSTCKDSLSRQVRFDDKSKKHQASVSATSTEDVNSINNTTTTNDNNNDDDSNNNIFHSTQPDSHPQLGPNCLPYLNRPPTWFTAADPTRSVNSQPVFPTTASGAAPPPHHFPYPSINHHHHHHQQQQSHHFVQPAVPYIAPFQQQQQHQQRSIMGDYQNCAPPPTGVNFQPPVPDTTFGPIQHVYVPRFDGSLQVGASFPFVSTTTIAAAAACVAPLMTTISPGPAVGPLPVQNTYVVPQPSYVSMPASQPVMVNGQAYVPAVQGVPCQQPVMAATTPMMATAAVPGPPSMAVGGEAVHVGAPIPIIPGNATSSNVPDVSGLGKTPHEETLRQVEFAYNNRLFEPQEFKPADDDPSRFYYVREVDGNWTQRNRFTIDHMGGCRWYVTDEGWFYAVRLPD